MHVTISLTTRFGVVNSSLL